MNLAVICDESGVRFTYGGWYGMPDGLEPLAWLAACAEVVVALGGPPPTRLVAPVPRRPVPGAVVYHAGPFVGPPIVPL